jgi:hypothetical protein
MFIAFDYQFRNGARCTLKIDRIGKDVAINSIFNRELSNTDKALMYEEYTTIYVPFVYQCPSDLIMEPVAWVDFKDNTQVYVPNKAKLN